MNKHEIIKSKLKQNVSYSIQKNAICFLPGDHQPSNTAGASLLGKIQDSLKRMGWLYYGLVKLFKPVWKSKMMRLQFDSTIQRFGSGSMILNLGSGPRRLKNRPDIINVDLYAFNEVDMIADAENLPLENGSVDLIINQAMLEHVPHPENVVMEMHRLLQPGGEVFCYLPFMVPFHAAPHDYYRWTIPGVRKAFDKFDHVEVGIGAGPTSGMLWLMQEWLALLFSFGSRRLHDIIFLILMVLTAPLKMFDLFMVHLPFADKIASGFYVAAKKEK